MDEVALHITRFSDGVNTFANGWFQYMLFAPKR